MTKQNFSSPQKLWRPDIATELVERVRSERGAVKPRYFRPPAPESSTEAERYTAAMVHRMCEVAFGAQPDQNIHGRQRLWRANALWIEQNIPMGKGAGFDDLHRFIAYYTNHVSRLG